MTTDLPPVPDGDDPVVVGRIGADLLVGAGAPTVSEAAVINSRLWLFSPADRRYREAADLSPLRPAEGSQVAVAGQRIVVISRVYDAKAKGLTMVTTFARPGAARTVVATAPYLASVTGFGADDRYAYWQSTRPGSGTEVLYRTRLDGGEPGPAPGFDGLRSDGTGWSRNAAGTVFRDLSGGERRSAVRPPGADEFRCVPAFCLGHDARGWFVQKLDGAGRTALPGDGAPTLVGGFNTPAGPGGKAADGGLLLLAGGVLLDPVSGRYGSVAREPHCEVRSGRITTLLTVSWRTRIDGVCTGPRTTAYLAPAD